MKDSKIKLNNIIGLSYLVIAIIILFAIYIFAPVCDNLLELANGNMVHMRCYYTAQAATYFAILLVACSLTSLISKRNVSLITLIIGIMLLTITISEISSLPIGIGVCKKSTMSCIKTAMWLKGSGIVTIILSIFHFVINKNKINS